MVKRQRDLYGDHTAQHFLSYGGYRSGHSNLSPSGEFMKKEIRRCKNEDGITQIFSHFVTYDLVLETLFSMVNVHVTVCIDQPLGVLYENLANAIYTMEYDGKVVTFPIYNPQEVRRVITSALLTETQSLLDVATMSVFIIIVFLSLMKGKSGGAIKPVVTFTPNWGNILEGDNVTLTCNVTSTAPEEPRTYHWYKDGSTIHRDEKTLQIKFSAEQESGDYQCRINTGDISDPVTLNVTIRHVLLQRPPSAIYEGDPLTLRCHHIEGFIGSQTRFFKNNEEIKSQFPGSEFRIQKADLNTAGLYKCTKQIASSGRSSLFELSDEFSLSVRELFSRPEIKVTPSRVIEGGEMTVRCDTRLDPLRGGTELNFAFYRDGRTVRGYDVSDTYRVPSSQLEDSGKYTCEVKMTNDTVRKMSDGLYIQMYDYTVQNIIRLVISGFVLAAALCFIYFHNKW
ncbi:high affinity immunoglobulin gamma Fc receptor I-like [Lithobates pipiens]